MDILKYRRAANDTKFMHSILWSSAFKRSYLHEARYMSSKADSFLPPISRSKGGQQYVYQTESWRAFNDKENISPTTGERQLMPRRFKHFWQQHQSSLAIQPSKFYQDIDAFSIDVIREFNAPHVVLPSLKNKVS